MSHRPIKFRAWLTNEYPAFSERNTMLQSENLSIDAALEGVGYGNVILMQFTGLKDKNGIDIYEGDLVKLYRSGNYVNCTVVWNKLLAMFALEWPDGYVNQHPLFDSKYEIVGNIYQPPKDAT